MFASWDDFYSLSRSILVKDEKYFDKFDKAFGVYFNGIENMDDILKTLIPEEWMRQQFEKELTKEELDKINDLGGLENLMREFKKRLEEQEKNTMVAISGLEQQALHLRQRWTTSKWHKSWWQI